ncbi:thioredoxin fold domain-containing protein [Marinobacter halophilus]|uniref:Thiol:disulfide interchange protein n=1 Tax=Marinobacter halophilus TaxID=1323740 RepID=A0A2T1KBL1_9GAMM|nr:thioredoxin fold domain-containing protein [Marinobacter halophilus]PSF07418.1 protein-disulfide isomerase [Marinobacter halophilus]GGC81161.1 thiol:disulfide interchange protein DsbC [Marinobacter halophilus]
MNLKILAAVAGLVLSFAGVSVVGAAETEDRIAKQLMQAVPGLSVTSVRESEAGGLYEVQSNNGDTIYTTADGVYLLTGDLLKITDNGIANVSEASRAGQRKEQMAAFGAKGIISYPAKGEQKAVIDVFTDIDCPYCRKMHDEVPELNEYGITVNYYGFPRSGPGTPSFRKYESVWCADNQQKAMDTAKAGKPIAQNTCDNPVEAQYRLGGQVGVTGTPAILLEDGNVIRGYVPARSLAEGLGIL